MHHPTFVDSKTDQVHKHVHPFTSRVILFSSERQTDLLQTHFYNNILNQRSRLEMPLTSAKSKQSKKSCSKVSNPPGGRKETRKQ